MKKNIFKFFLILMFITVSLIFSNVSFAKSIEVPQNVKEIIKESVEDTTWITDNSEDVLKRLKKLYTNDLVEKIWPEIEAFKEIETDWHFKYKVIDFIMYLYTDKISTVKVKIQESNVFDEKEKFMYGIFELTKSKDNWKIKSYFYRYQNFQFIDSDCSL